MQPRVVSAASLRKSARNADERNFSLSGRGSASVAWIDSFENCTIGHGSMPPHGLMWWLMPVAAGQRALPFAVVVGVDDDDRLLRPHLDDELPRPEWLLRRQAQVRVRVRPHRPVDVEPGVQHAHLDQPVDPLFAEQVVDVRAGRGWCRRR